MRSFWRWSQTPASNATADPSVNYREGQGAGSLNDSARAAMSALSKFRDDITGALAFGGTSSSYTLTTNSMNGGVSQTAHAFLPPCIVLPMILRVI